MKRNSSELASQTLEEASAWFVIFRAKDVDESARREFHDWLKRSPDHVRAYLEIALVYADIPAPPEGRTPVDLIDKARSGSSINVIPLMADELPGPVSRTPGWSRVLAPTAPARTRTTSRIVAAVAAMALILAGMWLYAQRGIYATTVGEQRSITLSDGSIVELDACSRIRVAFRAQERDIELLAGQALFQVEKNPSRPFVVSTGNAEVRAVGTQFDVDQTRGGTTVTVLEGRVRVGDPRPWEADGNTLLSAGEQMTVTPLHIERVDHPDISAAVAWTQHRLVFDGTPLGEVVEEFNRYSPHRLVIDSPDLARLRISGQYTSSDPASLIRFLSLQKGVVVTERRDETHFRRE